jgi:hypothetical protein
VWWEVAAVGAVVAEVAEDVDDPQWAYFMSLVKADVTVPEHYDESQYPPLPLPRSTTVVLADPVTMSCYLSRSRTLIHSC